MLEAQLEQLVRDKNVLSQSNSSLSMSLDRLLAQLHKQGSESVDSAAMSMCTSDQSVPDEGVSTQQALLSVPPTPPDLSTTAEPNDGDPAFVRPLRDCLSLILRAL